MKYARIERERRFLLAQLPADFHSTYHLITDRYIDGTQLRLRRVEKASGELVALKLTQKYRETNADFGHTTITNFYLNEYEFQQLVAIAGSVIRKQRFKHVFGAHTIAIDVFLDELCGLILAEIEFEDDNSMMNFQLTEFAATEVTDDSFFTGGHLANVRAPSLQCQLLCYKTAEPDIRS